MDISVVMPCYNCGPWVQEALQSIAAQIYQPMEIMVIDDGSTDDSVEKIKTSGVDVRLLHTKLGNAAATRNIGINEAKGDWIAFLDADDIWYPRHLESFVKLVSKTTDVAFFGQPLGLFGDTVRDTNTNANRPSSRSSALTDKDLYDIFVGPNSGWPTSAMVVSKARLEEAGGFDETQVRRHDFEMFLRSVKGHTWSYETEPTWLYRIRSDGNISSRRLDCAIYRTHALLKVRRLYGGAPINALIRREAKKSASYALCSGEPANYTWARNAVWPELSPLQRLCYGLGMLSHPLGSRVLRMWRDFRTPRT